MLHQCVVCGSAFTAKTNRAKYCCKKCANHSRFSRTHKEIRSENEELEKELLDLHLSGLRDKEIAQRIGRSVSWVQKRRVSMGVERHHAEKEIRYTQMELRACKCCSSLFVPKLSTQIYCSEVCERKANRKKKRDYDRKRTLKKQRIDYIPLLKLYERDHGICYLCGEKCDFNAVKKINGVPYALGDYPSRDHVKPLSQGGLHSWDNVRLAHIRCNSSKGAKYG